MRFEFYSKTLAVKKVMISTSAKPWGQKRTTLTQELMRGLLNCSKELPCLTRRKHFNDFMQPLKNSGYSEPFRAEILVETSIPPQRLERIWMEKRRKKRDWLGNFWKSCISSSQPVGRSWRNSCRRRRPR